MYGIFGRPDMSIFIFIKSILQNKTIFLNNYGQNFRDYTYVEDVVKFINDTINKTYKKKDFFKILNIGGEFNIKLTALVKLIEKKIKKKSKNSMQTKKILLDPVNSLASTKKIKNVTKVIKTGLSRG